MLSTLSNITQQLLQELVSNRVRLMVMEKANTLDLSFFENPEFYDKLRQAQEQATFRPVTMVSQTFDLVRTFITFLSMIFFCCGWPGGWPLVALLVPIPAFIADSRYGWMGYQRMRRQSPERREMSYFENGDDDRHLQQRDQTVQPGRLLRRTFSLAGDEVLQREQGHLDPALSDQLFVA